MHYPRDSYGEYVMAMRRVQRALRRGDMKEVKAWVAIAERLLAMENCHDGLRTAGDKREALREEQPLRLKLLEGRARWVP